MRIITVYLARQTLLPSREEAMIAFPRGYRELIEPLAKEEDIPPFLLYALVREESYFNPESESSAGARGLMQLMPVTAEEMARLLKIGKTDLSDPETNLRLGTYHFGRLYRRLENIPKALMAYNAGLSRVRSWENQYGDLTNELLVEVLPYAETRHYVRKIFVSSVFYGFLYEGKEPGEILRFFYPDLDNTLPASHN
jgi:soluble lytic murein transglycosylase